MDMSTKKAPYSPHEAAQQMLDNMQPEPSLHHRLRPRSAERLSAERLSANIGSCVQISPCKRFNCTKKNQMNDKQEIDESTAANRAKLNTENKLDQHRGRSRIRSQSRPRTASCTTLKRRIHSPIALAGRTYRKDPACLAGMSGPAQSASSRQSSEHPSIGFRTSRPPGVCRFSHEDYKHFQIIGWLEGDVVGNEVIVSSVLTPLQHLTMTGEISSFADQVCL